MSLSPEEIAQLAAKAGITTPVLKQRVEDKVADVIYALNRLKPQEQLPQLVPPYIKYDLRGTTAGQAVYDSPVGSLRVNLDYISDSLYTEDYFSDTLPHEVCHIACHQWWPNEAIHHGYKWRLLMMKLGLDPKRTHNYKAKKARRTTKYLYRCGCPNYYHKLGTTRHKRHNRTSVYSCLNCGQPLVYTGNYVTI